MKGNMSGRMGKPRLMEEAERNGSFWGEVLSKTHIQVTNGHRKLFLPPFCWVGLTVAGQTVAGGQWWGGQWRGGQWWAHCHPHLFRKAAMAGQALGHTLPTCPQPTSDLVCQASSSEMPQTVSLFTKITETVLDSHRSLGEKDLLPGTHVHLPRLPSFRRAEKGCFQMSI